MAEKPKLEARIPVTTAMTLRVVETGGGTATVTVLPAQTAGYYLTSTNIYLTTIANSLTNDATLAATYTLTVSDGNDSATGKTTLAASGGGVTEFAITWIDTTYGTTIQTALGMDDNLSGALTYTSEGASPYLWLPNVGRTTGMGAEPSMADQFGAETSDLVVTEAPSAAAKVFSYGRRDIERLAFANVIGSKMFERRQTVNAETLQGFWQKLIDDSGMRLRYHPDRSSDTNYLTCVAKWPTFAPEPATDPTNEGAYSLWNIAFDVIKHV